jgi:AraC-like DNA-binding protein
MPNADLPVSHATHLVPYVRFLDRIGAPVESALEQMHLPGGLLSTPNCYVPTASLFGFIGRAARKEGIGDLGFRVAYAEGLGLLGPTLAGKVRESPTLFHALQTFCHFANEQASQFWTWIVEDRDKMRVHIHRTFEPGVLGYTQTEWIGVMGVVTIVQLFAGPRWQPSRISLGTRSPVPECVRETLGDTQFLTRQPEVYIAFPRSTLSLRRCQHSGDSRFDPPGTLSHAYSGNEPEPDFAGRLMQCLEPHFLDGYPPVTLAAEIAGTSTRTLQRRLADRGSSYSEVVDRARFDVASRMLTETDAPSIRIAHATGYNDPSHFARAFRRLTGLSPREYRSQAGQVEAE